MSRADAPPREQAAALSQLKLDAAQEAISQLAPQRVQIEELQHEVAMLHVHNGVLATTLTGLCVLRDGGVESVVMREVERKVLNSFPKAFPKAS